MFATWSGRWHVRYGGLGAWQNLGEPSSLTVSSLRFADFNGDGTADVFATWSGRWHVRYSGLGAWQNLLLRWSYPSALGLKAHARPHFGMDWCKTLAISSAIRSITPLSSAISTGEP